MDGALQAGFPPAQPEACACAVRFGEDFFLSIFNDGELGSPVEAGGVEVGIIFSMTFFKMKTVVHSLALA